MKSWFGGTRARADGIRWRPPACLRPSSKNEMLNTLHDEADVVVETGNLNVHELRDRLIELSTASAPWRA